MLDSLVLPGAVVEENPLPSPPPTDNLTKEMSSLKIGEEIEQVPRRRQSQPQYDQKRIDPFLFGSRYLGEEDDVFEYNAWDHVETDEAYKEYAERQFELQRQSPLSDFEKSEYARSFYSFCRHSRFPSRETQAPSVMIYFQMHSSSESTLKTIQYHQSFAPI